MNFLYNQGDEYVFMDMESYDQISIPAPQLGDSVKFLKDNMLKNVQAAIQADQVRVSSPSKDELQEAMRLLREHDFGVALQFGNYRG